MVQIPPGNHFRLREKKKRQSVNIQHVYLESLNMSMTHWRKLKDFTHAKHYITIHMQLRPIIKTTSTTESSAPKNQTNTTMHLIRLHNKRRISVKTQTYSKSWHCFSSRSVVSIVTHSLLLFTSPLTRKTSTITS